MLIWQRSLRRERDDRGKKWKGWDPRWSYVLLYMFVTYINIIIYYGMGECKWLVASINELVIDRVYHYLNCPNPVSHSSLIVDTSTCHRLDEDNDDDDEEEEDENVCCFMFDWCPDISWFLDFPDHFVCCSTKQLLKTNHPQPPKWVSCSIFFWLAYLVIIFVRIDIPYV